jgi:succinoglycan biosynthesis transport protein ExoP
MDSLQNQPQQETRLHFLDYWRIIRIRKAIIITVFLITAIVATAVTFLLPESYASTARIRIEPDSISDIRGVGDVMPYAAYDPYFIQTEFEVIQDRVVLGKVIESLNLNELWGKKILWRRDAQNSRDHGVSQETNEPDARAQHQAHWNHRL